MSHNFAQRKQTISEKRLIILSSLVSLGCVEKRAISKNSRNNFSLNQRSYTWVVNTSSERGQSPYTCSPKIPQQNLRKFELQIIKA